MRTYSAAQVLVNNLPYIAMIALGAAVFLTAFEGSLWPSLAAAAYFAYGLAGALWIMIFVCPYCRYYNTNSCPCGYGTIAAKLRPQMAHDCFNEKFKKHIPVIVPLWFIPLLAGVPFLIRSFSWPLLILLVVFALDAFLLLPLFSVRHGCTECPQKDTCPWMGRKRKPAAS
jgi:hypothetical protein